MNGFWVAIAMYSRLPARHVPWEKKALAQALCWFPFVGVVIGGALLGWLHLSHQLGFGTLVTGGIALAIPILISGGIHMDGLCDTVDALASGQSRERKLEILKDSHAGAFAIIFCGLYLLVFWSFWCEVILLDTSLWLPLSLTPVLSRSLSGLWATLLPNARGSGLLATFTSPMEGIVARLILLVWACLVLGVMVVAQPLAGVSALVGAGLVSLYYVWVSHRQFGGITGDLAGYFLQLCELATVAAIYMGWHIGGIS